MLSFQDAGIKAELKWNMADSKKSDLDKATQERDKIMATVKILESDIEKEKNARKELQSARDKVDADLHINRESLEVCETQREMLDKQSKGADEEWQSYLNEIDQKQTSVASMRREIRELGNEILKHKKRKEVDERKASAEREQCKKDLASLEKQKEANSKKIQDWGKVREDGQEQLDKIKEEERSKKKELHRLGKELERAEEDLVRSRSASSSANLARFGPKIEAMVQEINSGRVSFRKKPIGPIGMHMKLTELASGQPEIPSLLESFLGYERFRGFLVDNNDDWKKLNEIMKRHFYGQKPPNIYTVQFKSRRDDISRGMVRSTSEIKTILDYLIVDDDNVFMHLVEWARIESTLVVTDAQAQRLFGRQENVPPNALKAITPTFYSYEPASKRSNYASYHINRRSPSILVQDKQSNVRQLEIKRNELKCKINEADCSFKDFERRTTDANKDISRAKKEISQLQLNIKDCLSKTQERMNRLHELNQDQNVENLQARKASKEAEIKAIEKELEGSKARKAKLKEEQDILKKKLNDIEDQIKNLRKDSELIR